METESGESAVGLFPSNFVKSYTAPIASSVVRAELQRIYEEHKPSKLEVLDELLAEWEGDEAKLLANVREKYLSAEQVAMEQAQDEATSSS